MLQSPFEQIKERLDVVEVAEFYGAVVQNHKARCVFHAPDKHPSLTFKNGRFKCWSCGAGGDVLDYVGRLFGLDVKDAAAKLDADFGLGIVNRRPTQEERSAARERAELASICQGFETWKDVFQSRLNACIRLSNEAKRRLSLCSENADARAAALDMLTAEQVRAMQLETQFEYYSDLLENGTMGAQIKIFRQRKEIEEQWIKQVLPAALPSLKTA